MNKELLVNLRRLVVVLLLTTIFVLLKLTLLDSLSWWFVFSPIILTFLFLFLLALFIIIGDSIGYWDEELKEKEEKNINIIERGHKFNGKQ
jgi:hypothetical protein